uniref:NADH-ubiquinone oxidoreductase chain 3 n=1 Tax=Petrobiona massiliana TaxID=68578 RepID=A0A140CUT0_9METZ|nr:NADH dehydrogenase subunit 3 [Petrobiona massiliana]
MFISWCIVISLLLLTVSYILGSHIKVYSKSSRSPYECGFNPIMGWRLPFNVHFSSSSSLLLP